MLSTPIDNPRALPSVVTVPERRRDRFRSANARQLPQQDGLPRGATPGRTGAVLAHGHDSGALWVGMSFKCERSLQGKTLVLTLSGRVQSEHLEELAREQLATRGPLLIDLSEVTLVDVEVVRFLAAAEVRGVTLRSPPRFVREWITREAPPGPTPRKPKKRKTR
jgi:hypothetical protein